MNFHIITIFPEIFQSYFKEGVIRRAQMKEKIKINIHNLRDYTTDKHKTVDDTPYGGGPGMVLKLEPIFKCVEDVRKQISDNFEDAKIKTVLFSAKGKRYDQTTAKKWAGDFSHIIMICGRYEGVDERVAQFIADEEISIGDYILTGGEVPAMVVVDSVSRLVGGVLGNEESLASESHEQEDGFKFDFPVYTKPEEFEGWKVPEVLLGGNHKEISEWRQKAQKELEEKYQS